MRSNNIGMTLILGYFWILHKGRRPYPIGTIQNRKDGRYRKESERKWEKLPSVNLGQVVQKNHDIFHYMDEILAFKGHVFYRNLEETEKVMRNIFGRVIGKEDLARLGCIFRNHSLIVEAGYDEKGVLGIYLMSWNKYETEIISSRMIYHDHIQNNKFTTSSDSNVKDMGTYIFYRQAQVARSLGLKYIICDAYRLEDDFGNLTYNGYYTWPRLGFDANMFTKIIKLNAYRNNYAEDGRYDNIDLSRINNISDLMRDDVGRKFWKEFGTTLRDCKFDLSIDSKSNQTLEIYLLDRYSKKRLLKEIQNEERHDKRGN